MLVRLTSELKHYKEGDVENPS